ncbi:hypothetical protein HAX40_16595 [Enterococcus casseliflavus]|nr:hypothetical protein [Enterococcus casseliflavus]
MSNDFRDLKSNTENENKENHNKKDKSLDILKDKLKNTDYKQKINDLDIESKAKFALEKTKEGLIKTKEVYQAEETQIILKKTMNILYKLLRYYPLFKFKYNLKKKFTKDGVIDEMLGKNPKDKKQYLRDLNSKSINIKGVDIHYQKYLNFLYKNSAYLMICIILIVSSIIPYSYKLSSHSFSIMITLYISLFVITIIQSFTTKTGKSDVDTIINYYLRKGVGLSDLREIVEKYEEIKKDFKSNYLTSKSGITKMTLDFDAKLGLILQLDLENIDDTPINTLANVDYLKPFGKYGGFYLVADNKAYIMFDIYLSKTIYVKEFNFVEFFKDDEAYLNYFSDYEVIRNTRDLNKLKQELEKANLDISADIVNKLQKKINKKNEENEYVFGFLFDNNLGKNLKGDRYKISMICTLAHNKVYKDILKNKDLIERALGYDVSFRPHKNKSYFYLDIKLADRKRTLSEIKQSVKSSEIDTSEVKLLLEILDTKKNEIGFEIPFDNLNINGNDRFVEITADLLENKTYNLVKEKKNKDYLEVLLGYTISIRKTNNKRQIVLVIYLNEKIDKLMISQTELQKYNSEDKIVLGNGIKGLVTAKWKHGEAYHMFINGGTNSGKTVTVRALISQLTHLATDPIKKVIVTSGLKVNDFKKLKENGAFVEAGPEKMYKALLLMNAYIRNCENKLDKYILKDGNATEFNKVAEDDEKIESTLFIADELGTAMRDKKYGGLIDSELSTLVSNARAFNVYVFVLDQVPLIDSIGQSDRLIGGRLNGFNTEKLYKSINPEIGSKFAKVASSPDEVTNGLFFYNHPFLKAENAENFGDTKFKELRMPYVTDFNEALPKLSGAEFAKYLDAVDEDTTKEEAENFVEIVEQSKSNTEEKEEALETIEENCDLETESQDTNIEVEVAEEEGSKPLNEVTNVEEETNSNADLTEIFKDLDL